MKERAQKIARNRGFDGSGASVNEQLTDKLHKRVTKNFKGRKVYARFKDNIWAADLTEMGPLSSKNKNVNTHWKNKKGKTVKT